VASDRDGSGHDDHCSGARDIALVNGRIVTMDEQNSIVSSANIKNGRFVAVGPRGDHSHTPCTKVIVLTIVGGKVMHDTGLLGGGR
jgi:predicted amidohydrolase YtcJ